MDNYDLFKYEFVSSDDTQGNFFISEGTKPFDPTADNNASFDRLFGERKGEVRIQEVKPHTTANKYPCTVMEHKDRVVWLRMENEKAVEVFKKRHSIVDIDSIQKEPVPSNPFSFIFLDCREGNHLIAIKKESAAWRNTDIVALLLQENLNVMMEQTGYAFRIRILPEKLPRDFFQYNSFLIKTQKKKIKKMVIKFKSGTIDPKAESIIRRTPLLERLLKQMWFAPSGEYVLHNPEGERVFDKRLVDVRRIVELIMCLGPNMGFGLSLSYESGEEISCGEDVRLSYGMKADTLKMLFDRQSGADLFGEYEVNKWLDSATDYIKKMKDEGTAKTKRNRKTPKHARDTSTLFDI